MKKVAKISGILIGLALVFVVALGAMEYKREVNTPKQVVSRISQPNRAYFKGFLSPGKLDHTRNTVTVMDHAGEQGLTFQKVPEIDHHNGYLVKISVEKRQGYYIFDADNPEVHQQLTDAQAQQLKPNKAQTFPFMALVDVLK